MFLKGSRAAGLMSELLTTDSDLGSAAPPARALALPLCPSTAECFTPAKVLAFHSEEPNETTKTFSLPPAPQPFYMTPGGRLPSLAFVLETAWIGPRVTERPAPLLARAVKTPCFTIATFAGSLIKSTLPGLNDI